jgi:hypothetical protein
MPEIEGITSVMKTLQDLRKKIEAEKSPSVVVGYNAAYALFVHENIEMKLKGKPRVKWLTNKKTKKPFIVRDESGEPIPGKGMYWDPQGRGQSKFLEQPAREKRDKIASTVRKAFAGGASLAHALLEGGLFLQRESQKLVPVDTGNLKGSAFTEIEK